MTPGSDKRQHDFPEGTPASGAERAGCILEVHVNSPERRDERQRHQRHLYLGESKNHPDLGVEKSNWCVDRTDRKQRRVDDALTAQNDDPCKGADDDTRQERQEDDEDDERLGARSDPVVEPRDWKAQHQTQGGHFRAQQQRRAKHAQAEWIGQEMDVLADAPHDTGRIVVQ